MLVSSKPSARAASTEMPRLASTRWYAAPASATLTGRISGLPQRLIARYKAIPYAAPGLHFHSTEGSKSAGIARQSGLAPINDMAAKHTAPPIPATNPPVTG